MINNADGMSITPSVLVPADAEVVVGDRAPAAARRNGTLVYDAKRFIGKAYDAARMSDDARSLPFVEPGGRRCRSARRACAARGKPLRFAPEDVGASWCATSSRWPRRTSAGD